MMDDLIRRQDAIDALWKALYDYEDKTEKQFLESEELNVDDWFSHRIFVQNMSDIDRQTILNLQSAQQWIPVSERLPEKEGQYLVTLDFSWGKEIEMGDWFIFEDGHREWVNPNSHVTVAWMELPTPWKESEDKE